LPVVAHRPVRTDVRRLQPGRPVPGRDRRHLPVARPVCTATAAGELRRRGVDRAWHRVDGGGIRDAQFRFAGRRGRGVARGRLAVAVRYARAGVRGLAATDPGHRDRQRNGLHGTGLARRACAQAPRGHRHRRTAWTGRRCPRRFPGTRTGADPRRDLAGRIDCTGPARPVGARAGARWPGAHRRAALRIASHPTLEVAMNMILTFPLILLVFLLLVASVKILREYQRAVVFQLGRFWKVKGPGLFLLVPVVQQMVRVDLRTIVMDVPSQDLISHDNVSVKVSAVVYFRVVDPQKAIINVEHFYEATSQLAQTTLRSVLGQHDLDEMLAERDKLNQDIRTILDAQTDAWGIKVANVEIKHVDINEVMVRAIARQAEAERLRRAKVIHAEGERQAAVALVEAARLLGADPRAIQLRYLQTLTEIAGEKSSTIVFPLPIDVLQSLTAGRDDS